MPHNHDAKPYNVIAGLGLAVRFAAPTPGFAAGCDRVFPHLDGLFARLLELARRWDGPDPQWFRDWLVAEREATSLRTWQPLLVPGLLQTEGYARAILAAGPEADADQVER